MKNDIFNKENMNIFISPILMVIFTIAIIIFNIYLGIVGIVLSIILIFNSYDTYLKKDTAFKNFIDKLDLSFEGFTKNAIFKMPFPIVVLNGDYELAWYNSKFKNLIKEKESMIDKKIQEVVPVIEIEKLSNNEIVEFSIDLALRKFEVHKSSTIINNKEKMILLYLIDITEKNEIYSKYYDEKMVMMNIRNDNYEELTQSISSEKRPILFAEIDSVITKYFHKYGAFITKYENGRYTAVLQKKSLNKIIENKFEIVEKIKNISTSSTIPPTLSIGVGNDEETPREVEKSSNAALDIALGRGGDQIVIKSHDKLDYFGGKTRATQKSSKVKARVVSHALAQYIEKSSDIFISGHKNPDMDSYGSALGLWHMAMNSNKKAYIILSEVTPAIKNVYEYSVQNIKGLKEHIISPDEAFEKITATSMIFVTDNHRKNSIEEPRLFEKCSSIFIVDHHRRGSDYIDNSILSYEEPSASSASELVTELLMYMNEKVDINTVVANALLSGIVTDSKNFNQQTGVRTFEAAAMLEINGADTTLVKKLLSENFETLKAKADIIAGAEIYKEKYILGNYDDEIEGASLVASLAADELTTIQNIQASFVFVKYKDRIHISARSLGDISVQRIMERIGGGGHRTIAATQIDVTMEEAKKLLKKAIKEYESEK